MAQRGVTLRAALLAGMLLPAVLAVPQPASAYSVLAHEALIDALWRDELTPLVKRRFPRASDEAIQAARAFAYGGSVIQDLGYYPFGSRFFSNLVHYVRSGDFVAALLRESQTPDEYAFALGALAHYASDSVGHPMAVNRAVPIVYPELHEKHGSEVLYADSPSRHVMVEFAFDVVQVARGAFRSDVYQDLIGFAVATPVLERAFFDTYGLRLSDVFDDVDLAIGTYRRAVSQIIPDMTRLAWEERKDEIVAASPNVSERDVVFTMTARQYEDTFGAHYRKPSLFARIIVAMLKVVPKFGPFKPLAFEPLTPAAERMLLDSFARSRVRYRELLERVDAGRLALADADLDTGARPTPGRNRLADKTFEDLVARLEEGDFVGASPALRRAIDAHAAAPRRAARVRGNR